MVRLLGAIGSGLGTWAATGDIKKGILGGLTGYGLGKVFSAGKTAADAAGATAATKGAEALTSGSKSSKYWNAGIWQVL